MYIYSGNYRIEVRRCARRNSRTFTSNIGEPKKVVLENQIVQKGVEAKLHDESTMIQRCFDDNNDDNKR